VVGLASVVIVGDSVISGDKKVGRSSNGGCGGGIGSSIGSSIGISIGIGGGGGGGVESSKAKAGG